MADRDKCEADSSAFSLISPWPSKIVSLFVVVVVVIVAVVVVLVVVVAIISVFRVPAAVNEMKRGSGDSPSASATPMGPAMKSEQGLITLSLLMGYSVISASIGDIVIGVIIVAVKVDRNSDGLSVRCRCTIS